MEDEDEPKTYAAQKSEKASSGPDPTRHMFFLSHDLQTNKVTLLYILQTKADSQLAN